MELPANSAAVTHDFLDAVLSSQPPFNQDPIVEVVSRPIGEGIGQLSSMLAVNLICKSGKQQELVVKLHTPVADMHNLAMTYGLYEHEVMFYRVLGPNIPLRLPKVYFSEFDKERERVSLIMESFSGWHSPDQIIGPDVEELEIATDALALLAASTWNKPLMKLHSWLKDFKSPTMAAFDEQYPALRDEALRRLGDRLPEFAGNAAWEIGNNVPWIRNRLCDGNQVLSHHDWRVENFFFKGNEFVVIDWQLLRVCNPAADIAYMLGVNVPVEVRRRVEGDLLERFHQGLQQLGVTHYSLDQLKSDYRLCLLPVIFNAIAGGASFDESNGRSAQLMEKIVQRSFQAVEDWNSTGLFG